MDTIDFVDANQLKDVSSDSNLQLVTRSPLDIGRLNMNQNIKPFDDINVRKAISYAIDRKAIIDTFFPNGAAQAADS